MHTDAIAFHFIALAVSLKEFVRKMDIAYQKDLEAIAAKEPALSKVICQ